MVMRAKALLVESPDGGLCAKTEHGQSKSLTKVLSFDINMFVPFSGLCP